LEVTTFEQRQLRFSFDEVTWQQVSKHINKSIIGATVSMCRSQCLVVSGEEEVKASSEVPDTSLVECGGVWTGKTEFWRGMYFTY